MSFLLLSLHWPRLLFGKGRGGAMSQIYDNRIRIISFWEKSSQINSWVQNKRRSPFLICTRQSRRHDTKTSESKWFYLALTGVTTYPPCTKAICLLLNKRIIFYLDFCARLVFVAAAIQVGGCGGSTFTSGPCSDIERHFIGTALFLVFRG